MTEILDFGMSAGHYYLPNTSIIEILLWVLETFPIY